MVSAAWARVQEFDGTAGKKIPQSGKEMELRIILGNDGSSHVVAKDCGYT
jgi:hypothetical protein